MTENKQSYLKQYFLYQMGQLKACTIFSVIFAVIGFPVYCFAYPMMEYSSAFDDISVPLAVVGIIGIFGTCMVSFIAPIIALRHLYTKNYADNILSLPLTKNQQFLADIGAIFTCVHIPYGICAALSYFIEKFSCDYHLIAGRISQEPYVYQYVIAGFWLLVMFCAFNIAITTCCGRLTETIIYPIVMNIVIPVVITLGTILSYYKCFGFAYDSAFDIFTLNMISPLGALVTFSYNIGYENGLLHSMLGALVMSAIYIGAAFAGYTRRRAENIGKSFVFRYVYVIFTSLIALTVTMLYAFLAMETGSLGGIISVSAIVLGVFLLILMLILEVINSKKVKSKGKFAIRYAATLGGSILVCALLVMSKGFGASYRVPDAEDVEFISMSYTYNGNNDYLENNKDYRAITECDIFAADEETIGLICDEHKYIVENYESKPDDYTWGHIVYTMKNGKTIDRMYSNDTGTADFWQNIYNTEGYRVSELKEYEFRYERDNGNFKNSRFILRNPHSGIEYINVKADVYESGLIEALEKDLRADTEYGRHDEFPVGVLDIGYDHEYFNDMISDFDTMFSSWYKFTIYESYKNTLELLAEYGNVPTCAESLEDSIRNCKMFTLMRNRISDTDRAFNEVINGYNTETVFITAEEFKELAQKQVNYHTADNDGYIYSISCNIGAYLRDEYTNDDYIKALNEIGVEYDNYDFLLDQTIFGGYGYTAINESCNAECAELFNSRTVFTETY